MPIMKSVLVLICFAVLAAATKNDAVSNWIENLIKNKEAELKAEYEELKMKVDSAVKALKERFISEMERAENYAREMETAAKDQVIHLQPECSRPAVTKINGLVGSWIDNLINCPDLEKILNDIDMIALRAEELVADILISIKDRVVAFVSCLDNPLTASWCFAKETGKSVEMAFNDTILVFNFTTQVMKYSANMTLIVWDCAKYGHIQESIQGVLDGAKQCNMQHL